MRKSAVEQPHRFNECTVFGRTIFKVRPRTEFGIFSPRVEEHTISIGKKIVRAKGLEPLRLSRHWNLNPARLPIPPRPRGRLNGPRNKLSPSTTNCLIDCYTVARPRSGRSLSTWPLARTLY